MLQSEFIEQYCKDSKVTEADLLKYGLFAVPCDCGNDKCDGWSMQSKESLLNHIKLNVTVEKRVGLDVFPDIHSDKMVIPLA